MSIPTPEQARQLVEHFGGQYPAADAVGVSQSTIARWLNPAAAKAAKQRWRDANAERMREAQRAWRARPEVRAKLREQGRNNYWKNPEARRKASQRWYHARPEERRRRQQERYYRRKDEGLCVRCGKEPALTEILCGRCLDRKNAYHYNKQEARLNGISE